MIRHPGLETEPWGIRERSLDLKVQAQMESVLALSNGHIGLRANLDEGEPHAIPGTYLNAFYEVRPLPYAEAGYGYPESGQTVVNVTDGKIIRLLVDDEMFDVRYGRLLSHERFLDFRSGLLERRVEWRSPPGRTVRITSTRLVSFAQRSVAAVLYEVEALDGPTRFVVQSELVANEPMGNQPLVAAAQADPREAAALSRPLVGEDVWQGEYNVVLVHRTRGSGLRMAAGMDHVLDSRDTVSIATESSPDLGRVTFTAELEPGSKLRIIKFLAYAWSSQRSVSSVRDQVDAALASARHSGWDGLVRDQREYLDAFWSRADVELGGDPRLQQAVRFGLFQVLQAGARAEDRAIAAKGLTGPGYDGHTFWDSETFVLPVLTYTAPEAAASVLRWRHATLPLARERARLLRLGGAAFPWRTIRGQESSGYWPAGTAAFHINADIADAVIRYVSATQDVAFERDYGLELLVETARLWITLGHFERGAYRIDGVTGPDEYSAIADNNVYTNLMAQRNLRGAADASERHPDLASSLGVEAAELKAWRAAAAAVLVPMDAALGVHQQSEGFTEHKVWDFENTAPEEYPLLLHFPYFDLYRKQVIKQADLVLALHLRGDAFTLEEKRRDFDYYDPITVRDSSLSACTQSVVAAEVGYLDLAYDYLVEAALMDLEDFEHNVHDGLHLAALAGAWIALVAGFGGLRDHGPELSFSPRLPPSISRLAFNLAYRGRRLRMEMGVGVSLCTLTEGEPLDVCLDGETVTLAPGRPVRRPLAEVPSAPNPPRPPRGREPQLGRSLRR